MGSHCPDSDYTIFLWSYVTLPLRHNHKRTQKRKAWAQGLDQTYILPNIWCLCPWDNTPVKSLRKRDYCKLHAALNVCLGCNLESSIPEYLRVYIYFFFFLIFCPLWSPFSEKYNWKYHEIALTFIYFNPGAQYLHLISPNLVKPWHSLCYTGLWTPSACLLDRI